MQPNKYSTKEKPRRKGAMRRADIPPDVLQGLNEGREETITLVEWLAIDMPTLLGAILPDVGLADARDELVEKAQSMADEGVTRRLKGIGQALFAATQADAQRAKIFEALASHTSDMVRAWAAYMLTADKDIPLDKRLEATRRFAADGAASVREIAWDSFRPYVAAGLEEGIRLLEPWVRDADANIRRCAVEGTRPRGVWTAHLEALKQDPEPGLALLEPVRSDPSRYVQNAAANWLNDASKSRPDWVKAVAARWAEQSLPERRPTSSIAVCARYASRGSRTVEERIGVTPLQTTGIFQECR